MLNLGSLVLLLKFLVVDFFGWFWWIFGIESHLSQVSWVLDPESCFKVPWFRFLGLTCDKVPASLVPGHLWLILEVRRLELHKMPSIWDHKFLICWQIYKVKVILEWWNLEAVIQNCSVKKVLLEISLKFTGKKLCQIFFYNKVAGLRPATLSTKILWHPMNFVKFLRTAFFIEHLM